MKMAKYLKSVVLVAAAVVLLASCATRNKLFEDIDKNFDARDYKAALALVDSKDSTSIYPDQDKVLRELDAGMLLTLDGDDKSAAARLDEAERLIEENFTKSITEAAGSFLLNDTVMAYPGEAYEDIYLNVFKAMGYAHQGQMDGAFVEVRRMQDKMNLLETKYGKLADSMNADENAKGSIKEGDSEFSSSALAHFLSLVLYRADGKMDDARLDLKKIKEAFATQKKVYDFSTPNLDAAVAPAKDARLTVIAFSGRSPAKKAITYRITTGYGTVTVSMEQENSSGYMQTTNATTIFVGVSQPGYNFKCMVPYMELVPSRINGADLEIDGKIAGSFQLIEKMDNAALDTFRIKEPMIYTKTIIRTVVKNIAAALGKQAMSQAVGGFSFLTDLATDIAVDASEQADLRSARFYPGKAWVGDVVAPEGEHDIRVIYTDGSGNKVFTDDLGKVNLKKKGLNMLPSYALL